MREKVNDKMMENVAAFEGDVQRVLEPDEHGVQTGVQRQDAALIAIPRSPKPFVFNILRDCDVPDYTRMLYQSFNTWYWKHGWGKDYFGCSEQDTSIFYDIYSDISPGHSVAAFDARTGKLMGACFYHPREHHVSLGIMCVHQDAWGQGVGRSLVEYILNFVRNNRYFSCRLVGSAMNMDSFSLYNRCGFAPKAAYHDMIIAVSDKTLAGRVPGQEHVRQAATADVARMGELEMTVSGIQREIDYRYAINTVRDIAHIIPTKL